jgi:outer membrane receptor protein involved in Fe transport
MTRRTLWFIAASLAAAAQQIPTATIQVTATRFKEDAAQVPASVTVISGEELRDRGATDLRSALSLVAGVTLAPGGDNGPAGSVPEMWGLREFDAFLLVVDGVPWGGTFNPALTTLDLENVERIEVQKGAAPVMYGATSFVGVIHVIHKAAADTTNSARLWAGEHRSGGTSATLRLPAWSGVDSALTFDAGKQGFNDDRTEVRRGTLAWRNHTALWGGAFRFDLSGAWIQQDPSSPVIREGVGLTTKTPLDANHNPADAKLNDRRLALSLGFDREVGAANWSSTLAFSRASQNLLRGFLKDTVPPPDNGQGFRQANETTDLYFDTHLAWAGQGEWKVVLGADHLHGQGKGQGGDFDYDANLDGSNPMAVEPIAFGSVARIDDRRDFGGLYAFAEFEPLKNFLVEGGLRFNHTTEKRHVYHLEFGPPAALTDDGSTKTVNRLTGSLGLTWTFWNEGRDRLAFFADARTAFKPAAMDFGIDSEPEILKPETAKSYEMGFKGSLFDGRLTGELAAFRMDMENMVVANSLGGTPALTNGGKARFQGLELSLALKASDDLTLQGSFASHDSRFTDSVQDFGGVPAQLAGKRLEMTPYHTTGVAAVYAPKSGFVFSLESLASDWVYLNKRNTAPSSSVSLLNASAGWRFKSAEVRLTGTNLTDKRTPVTESELGDAQYYLLPGRQINASVRFKF